MSEKKKFLYAATVSTAMQYSGILRKIAGQTAGMARLAGKRAIPVWRKTAFSDARGEQEERFPFPVCTRWSEQQNHLANAIGALLEEDPCDMVYIKGFLTNPYHRMIALYVYHINPSCRVVFEVATYPYWGEYKRFFRVDIQKKNLRAFLGHAKEVLQHAGTTITFSRYVDTVVTFGERTDSLWGIPAINVDNGVEVDAIPLREDRALYVYLFCLVWSGHLWCMAMSVFYRGCRHTVTKKTECPSFSALWGTMKPSWISNEWRPRLVWATVWNFWDTRTRLSLRSFIARAMWESLLWQSTVSA